MTMPWAVDMDRRLLQKWRDNINVYSYLLDPLREKTDNFRFSLNFCLVYFLIFFAYFHQSLCYTYYTKIKTKEILADYLVSFSSHLQKNHDAKSLMSKSQTVSIQFIQYPIFRHIFNKVFDSFTNSRPISTMFYGCSSRRMTKFKKTHSNWFSNFIYTYRKIKCK